MKTNKQFEDVVEQVVAEGLKITGQIVHQTSDALHKQWNIDRKYKNHTAWILCRLYLFNINRLRVTDQRQQIAMNVNSHLTPYRKHTKVWFLNNSVCVYFLPYTCHDGIASANQVILCAANPSEKTGPILLSSLCAIFTSNVFNHLLPTERISQFR